MPYSTANDPRMKRTKTLSDARQDVIAQREAIRSVIRDTKTRISRVKDRTTRLSEAERRSIRLRKMTQQARERLRRFENEQMARKLERERKRHRMAIPGGRGIYVEDAVMVTQWSRVDLDPASRPRGNGTFLTNDKLSEKHGVIMKGKFLRDKNHIPSKHGPMPEQTLAQIKRGATAEGPACYGSAYFMYGDGSWPGTDKRTYSKDPEKKVAAKDKDKGPSTDQMWDCWVGGGELAMRSEAKNIRFQHVGKE